MKKLYIPAVHITDIKNFINATETSYGVLQSEETGKKGRKALSAEAG